MPPGDDIETGDGTWLSLSLDADNPDGTSPAVQIGMIETALTSTPTPPQPPPRAESSAGDSPAPTLSSDADAPTAADDLAVGSGGSSASMSLDSLSSGGESRVEPTLIEEETESAQIPLPPPLQLTLKDEVLPWPPLLVAPTLVLPGAWPPPPGTLARSAPSLVDHGLDSFDEISIEAETGAMSVGSVSMELIIEDDSVVDVEIGEMQFASSTELPPVRGTLDEMPVVERASTSDDFDDIPTEVSQRDALEEALALLRTAAPGSPLGMTVEGDDDEFATTASDIDSLDLDLPAALHGPVDPAVRADMDASPGGAPVQRVAFALGEPMARQAALEASLWIDLVLSEAAAADPAPGPAAPPGPGPASPRPLPPITAEGTTDLVALAERRGAEAASRSAPGEGPTEDGLADPRAEANDDDWLSDLPEEDPSS